MDDLGYRTWSRIIKGVCGYYRTRTLIDSQDVLGVDMLVPPAESEKRIGDARFRRAIGTDV